MSITSYFDRNFKKLFFKKKVASFWIPNGTVEIKLLNDHVCSVTHEVDLLALTDNSLFAGTDRN